MNSANKNVLPYASPKAANHRRRPLVIGQKKARCVLRNGPIFDRIGKIDLSSDSDRI